MVNKINYGFIWRTSYLAIIIELYFFLFLMSNNVKILECLVIIYHLIITENMLPPSKTSQNSLKTKQKMIPFLWMDSIYYFSKNYLQVLNTQL